METIYTSLSLLRWGIEDSGCTPDACRMTWLGRVPWHLGQCRHFFLTQYSGQRLWHLGNGI